ncbi:MAG TPA: class I SAM-dependent methyltransferase [Terriglobia bacterium]|nr:class I SAM-dependent methyltransferase [Terriglobia bacterium]
MFNFSLRRKLDRVRHVWGVGNIWTPEAMSHWLQHPLVQARIDAKVTDGTGDRFQYFLRRYLSNKLPVERALTIGCGGGELERGLCKYDFARVHEGIDIAERAVSDACSAAENAGFNHLEYRVADANRVRLPSEKYDVVFGVSAIHHIERLEHLFAEVRKALKPGGYFFLDEYIGPSKFQWTDTQLRVMNEQLSLLPSEIKRRISDPAEIKSHVERKTVSFMNESDPSEAVRSGEIVPLLERHFKVLEFKGYGGSLLHELLYDIVGNFTEKHPRSLAHLERLFRVEDEQIALGELQHDFAVIVAQQD